MPFGDQAKHVGPRVAVVLLMSLAGCGDANRETPTDKYAAPLIESTRRRLDVELPSADYLLGASDYEKFRPGRSRDDILEDLNWWGNLEMATEYEGKSASAISYGILGGPYASGDIVWAIFVDDKFEKFVEWPHWGERPIKVGDFSRLVRALEGDPIDIQALDREMRSMPAPPRGSGGLSPAIAETLLHYQALDEPRMQRELRRNAELRDRFNAARLRIGMTQMEVESVLQAKPIEAGQVEAGAYKIYGSTESPDVENYQRYSNILILFRDEKLIGIYSGYTVPGGADGIRSLREPTMIGAAVTVPFADLPPVE